MFESRHLTPEHIRKIQLARKGYVISEETKIKMSNAARGKPKSDLHKLHISQGRILKYQLLREEKGLKEGK